VQLDNFILQNVSRETFSLLQRYSDQLQKWNQHINLIAFSTEQDIWRRHIEDSAQLYPYVAEAKIIADVGSGAGLPGMVLAILGCKNVHLIESDKRKSIFLKECVREFSLAKHVIVHDQRVESIPSLQCDVIVSRACASLEQLLAYAKPHMADSARCIFLKGKRALEEITIASKWRFDYSLHPSMIDSEGVILEVTNVEKKA
jgi:16S rRNA (guanine527-N7)-methyltransferase